MMFTTSAALLRDCNSLAAFLNAAIVAVLEQCYMYTIEYKENKRNQSINGGLRSVALSIDSIGDEAARKRSNRN